MLWTLTALVTHGYGRGLAAKRCTLRSCSGSIPALSSHRICTDPCNAFGDHISVCQRGYGTWERWPLPSDFPCAPPPGGAGAMRFLPRCSKRAGSAAPGVNGRAMNYRKPSAQSSLAAGAGRAQPWRASAAHERVRPPGANVSALGGAPQAPAPRMSADFRLTC